MSTSEFSNLLTDHTRLLIMSTLAASRSAIDFSTLLENLELTRGNLSTHMRKLEEDGLVQISKEFVDRKPRTTYLCTARGRKAVKEYLELVEGLLKGLRK